MNAYNSKSIDSADVAQRVMDSLSDFHNDGLITGATLRSKTNYTNIIKALNSADSDVCRDAQIHGQVVVYIPESTTSIPFNYNSRYQGQIAESLLANEDLSDQDSSYFLAKHDYINVVEINSRYLELFDKYPVGGVQAEKIIRKVGNSEFSGRGRGETRRNFSHRYIDRKVENYCTFYVDENRLVLSEGLTDPGFLRFTGRIFPGLINTSRIPKVAVDKCDYKAYKIVAPHTSMQYLVNSAVYHSLPISSQNARGIAGQSLMKERQDFLKMKPSDSNVVVPVFSF